MSDREELQALRRLAELEAKASPQNQVMGDDITKGALNFVNEMSGQDQFLAGVGKTLTDIGQGASQMVGLGPSRQEVDERRDRDVSLMATPAGFAGSVAGGVAATAPTVALGPSMPAVMATGSAYGALQPVGENDSRLLNAVLGAGTAGAMKYGIDKGAPLLASAVRNAAQRVAPQNARAAELAKVLQQGREAGLRVPPTQANPSVTNRILESIAGKAATQQQAAAGNQAVVYSAAQRHAGMTPNTALTEQSLAAARDAAAAPYKQVAAMNPQAAAALEAWKQANFEARMQSTFFQKSGNPEAYRAAESARQAADNALNQIEAIAGPAAKSALQEARRQIAKIHTVENLMRGSSVDAAALVREVNKGVPVSGELASMARFAQDFPGAMRAPQVGGSVGVNQLLPWLGGGGGAAIGGALGGPGGAGAGSMLGAMATQAIPPVARSAILSGPYQAMMTTPPQAGPGIGASLANVLLQRPEVRAMLPAAAAGYATAQ